MFYLILYYWKLYNWKKLKQKYNLNYLTHSLFRKIKLGRNVSFKKLKVTKRYKLNKFQSYRDCFRYTKIGLKLKNGNSCWMFSDIFYCK